MGFGSRVIGEEAVAAERAAQQAKKELGYFGKRVLATEKPVVPVAPVPTPEPEAPAPEEVAPEPRQPTDAERGFPDGEAYSWDQAIAVAKKNVHDLPRLLDLELARPDGPRKTVLKAYSELALAGELGDEAGLALDERIQAALAAKG